MLRTVLIRIATDPRKTARPAEAVRIAAGVGAWNKVQVHLLLAGEAARCLDRFADELESGELFSQYLPSVVSHGGKIVVEKQNPILKSIQSDIPFEKMTTGEIKQFTSTMDHVMQF